MIYIATHKYAEFIPDEPEYVPIQVGAVLNTDHSGKKYIISDIKISLFKRMDATPLGHEILDLPRNVIYRVRS